MIDPEILIRLFGFNAELIKKHTDRLSHTDSLKPLGTDGNSINWTLGHILSSRTLVFEYVPGEHVWTAEKRARYRHGSANVVSDGPGVLPLETLLADFRESQRRLEIGLHRLSDAQMSEKSGYDQERVGGRLSYLVHHETHHVGQLMSAAQAVGIDGGWLENIAVYRA
ncbi:MAG: DinB family protein [Chloroflexota bacterium]